MQVSQRSYCHWIVSQDPYVGAISHWACAKHNEQSMRLIALYVLPALYRVTVARSISNKTNSVRAWHEDTSGTAAMGWGHR